MKDIHSYYWEVGKGKCDHYKIDENLRIVIIVNFGGYARKKHAPTKGRNIN